VKFAVPALAAAIATQAPTSRVDPFDAPQHRGTVATVCGVIEKFTCNASEGTALNFEGQPRFRILIPAAERAALEKRVEDRFVDRNVCVTGPIERGGLGDQIIVRKLEEITITADSRRQLFAPHAYRSECDAGVILPQLLHAQKPAYTRAAMTAKIQGAVWMETVVETDGRPGEVRVIKSLRQDLDEQAVRALKKWRFKPATYNDAPVPVIVSIEMTFTLKFK
jgi:TonB family protein